MIGTRIGTGGSSGEQYLQGAVNKNYIFKELAGVITFPSSAVTPRSYPSACTKPCVLAWLSAGVIPCSGGL
jgi:hypothetical protein